MSSILCVQMHGSPDQVLTLKVVCMSWLKNKANIPASHLLTLRCLLIVFREPLYLPYDPNMTIHCDITQHKAAANYTKMLSVSSLQVCLSGLFTSSKPMPFAGGRLT